MNYKIEKLMRDYFTPSKDYFWMWVDNGKVLEWCGLNQTITYREDLVRLLKELAKDGLPPLSTVLLGITMCKNKWLEDRSCAHYFRVLMETPRPAASNQWKTEEEPLKKYLSLTIQFMDLVGELEETQRSGYNRHQLLRVLFKASKVKIPPKESQQIVALFNSGQYDKDIFYKEKTFSFHNARIDLAGFVQIAHQYPTKEDIELAVRTGLKESELPKPFELEIPEKPGDLLDILAEDKKTAGLANLTKHLMAALSLPLNTRGPSNLSMGGVSDITNRGEFDRLLLSELAYEDQSLMARLVNNEALYFHYEEPPEPQTQKRIILIDSTIKMWGLPKIFGFSAALACVLNNKNEVDSEVYTLDGNEYLLVDLNDKEGIIKGLERSSPVLYATEALRSYLSRVKKKDKVEVFYISTDTWMKSKEYFLYMEEIQQGLDYLISINRHGHLNFYQFKNGKRKLMASPIFDLEDLIFNVHHKKKSRSKPLKKTEEDHQAAFLNYQPFPMHLPSTGIRMKHQNTIYEKGLGVIAVDEMRKLMFWPSSNKGAVELLSSVEQGYYRFYIYEKNLYFLVYFYSDISHLYHIDLETFEVDSINFKAVYNSFVSQLSIYEEALYARAGSKIVKIAFPNLIIEETDWDRSKNKVFQYFPVYKKPNFNEVKQHINNGYNTIRRISRVAINKNGNLSVGKWELVLQNGFRLQKTAYQKLNENQPFYYAEEVAIPTSLGGNYKFKKFVWKDGSSAIIDPRGLVHLKSSNDQIPEITFVLICEKNTACWSSDKTFAGNMYFYNESGGNITTLTVFYEKKLKRFINEIKSVSK